MTILSPNIFVRRFLQLFIFAGILSFMFPGPVHAQTQNIRFEHLSSDNGLSQNSVLCILQDSRGFMWFGTYDGLNRYDGYEFKIYKYESGNPYSLSNNAIGSIYEDHSGVLWIGNEGGLDQYDREKERFIHYKYNSQDSNSLSSNRVQWICEDTSGVLWIGTFGGGLNQFDKERKRFIRYQNNPKDPKSISSNNISCVYIDRSGCLWLATDGGINRFDQEGNQFIRYQQNPKNPNSLSLNNTFRIYEDQSGVLWFGLWGGGLDRFDREKEQFIHYRNNPDDSYSLTNDVVTSMYEDRTGRLWIGTWGGGLDQLDRKNKRFVHYRTNPNDPNSLSNNSVISIYEDHSGILWIGNDFAGVNKYDSGKIKFVHYKKEPNNSNSLSSNTVYSIIETVDKGNKTLWIGTQAGGLNKFERGKKQFKHYQPDPHNPYNSINDNNIRTIIEDRTGALWIGTTIGGLDRFDRKKETFTHFVSDPNNPYSLSSNSAFSLCEDRLGYIWVGTYGEGLNKFDPRTKKFTRYKADPKNPYSLSDNFIWSIIEDRDGVLWIGTENGGLNQFDRDKNRVVQYKADPSNPNGLSGNKILCIHEDRSGMLWLGTTNGLNSFDRVNKRFSRYLEADGLPSNTIQSILEDGHGNLWLGTQKGLSKYDPRTKKCRNFKVSDGLQSNEFCVNASFGSQNGEMFFGGINGFNTFFPDSIKDNLTIPSIVITDFQIFNKSVPVGNEMNGHVILNKSISESKEINLSYKDNFFSFKFSSFNLTSPEENQYAYRMEGFDTAWMYTDASKRFASYTNMGGGEYVFHVKGSNSDGVWNEAGTSIRVIITPPFWKTLWFYIISALVLISGIAGAYRYRIYRVRVNERNLQKKVNERTQELAREVDDHRKTEEALQHERNLFRTLIDHLPDAIYVKDTQGRKTIANTEDVRLLGRQSEAEVLGKTEFDFYPADIAANYFAVDQFIIQTGQSVLNHEECIKDQDGSERWLLISKLPLRDEQNSIIGLVGVVRDMTEQRNLEAQFRRAQRMDSLGTLASGMAHDLKNLLVPVKMAAELLQRKHDDPKSRAMLISIGLSAEHSINLVQQVLAFVRGADGQLVPLHVADHLRRTLSAIQETLPSNIEISCSLPDNSVTVLGDDTQLRQVLVNLIANAKDAMPDGGRITLALTFEQVNKAMAETIPNAIEGSFVVLSIADTGTGIPPEKIEKIFEPFYTTKEISKGTGLGLSIVAGIIKGHKGFITIKSVVGQGTTFHVYLPQVQGDSPLHMV
jgi:PAS domain S-box-containing protein